ncbi:hypothetical protein MTO96_005983 [Rhipicephalus appendiculatus]
MLSTCQFKEPCTEEECRMQGKLCCKVMACGGCACVNDGCEDHTPSNETCEGLKCKSNGKTCCIGPCGDPFCA